MKETNEGSCFEEMEVVGITGLGITRPAILSGCILEYNQIYNIRNSQIRDLDFLWDCPVFVSEP